MSRQMFRNSLDQKLLLKKKVPVHTRVQAYLKKSTFAPYLIKNIVKPKVKNCV